MWAVRVVLRRWRDDRLGGIAAEIAFFGLLSLFPGLLALAGLLGSLGLIIGEDAAAQAKHEAVTFLSRVLTEDANGTLRAVEALFDRGSAGALSIGTVFAIWASSRAFVAVMAGLDVAYGIKQRRSYARLRVVAFALAAGTVLLLALLLAVFVVGPLFGTGHEIGRRLGVGGSFATLWDWARWPAAVVLIVMWTTTVFHVGANHRTGWRDDIPGALLTTGVWVGGSMGLRLYLAVAAGANQVLGALGGSLIVLVWFYVLGIGLLVGAQLNAALIARAADSGRQQQPWSE